MPAKTAPKKAPGANFMKGRPTLYKGIRMRSRTEADYAAWLDREERQWEYEPECFADEHGQWLPDFRVARLNEYYGVPHLIEVKPAQMLDIRKGERLDDVLDRVDDDVLHAWSRREISAYNGNGTGDKSRTEVLWSNRPFSQATLFDLEAG